MMKIQNQIQGAKNREAGALFEQMIDGACIAYAERGFAKIDKTPEPMRIIKPLGNGQYVSCFAKSAQPDYKGVLKGGREVCFEAKYTSTERMEQKRVTQNQTEALQEHAEFGALCFVVCGFPSGKCYRVPWGVWCGMKELYGRKYVTEEDLRAFAVRSDLKVWFLDRIGEAQSNGNG